MSETRVKPTDPWLLDGHEPRSPQVGTVLTMPGAETAELLAEPFDFVWIDLEHGALGLAEAQAMILGAQAAGAYAFVRLGLARADGLVGPILDAGADGIVAADVRSVSQTQWIAGLMHHPPVGRRGYGPRRSGLRGRIRGSRLDQAPQLWVQIESQEGVAAAQEIARTNVAGALVVGIADLCVDLDIPIGLTDPRLRDALGVVSDAVAPQRARFGLAGPLEPTEPLGDLLSVVNILVHSTDARLCAAAVDHAAQALRGVRLVAPASHRQRHDG